MQYPVYLEETATLGTARPGPATLLHPFFVSFCLYHLPHLLLPFLLHLPLLLVTLLSLLPLSSLLPLLRSRSLTSRLHHLTQTDVRFPLLVALLPSSLSSVLSLPVSTIPPKLIPPPLLPFSVPRLVALDNCIARYIIGASLSEPHTDGYCGAEVCSNLHQRGPGGPNSSRAVARRGYGCRHALRGPANSHVRVHNRRRVSLLACYLRFATSMDTTGSSQNRDERLRRRRERERTRHAGETAEQRERRLRQRRERDRARRTARSSERRESTLQQMRATSSERLASEIAEEREARLQG